MKKRIAYLLLAALTLLPATLAAKGKVIVIMVDGYRWQDLYRGPDPALMDSAQFGNPGLVKADYLRATPEESRKALMPFTWTHIAKHVQIDLHIGVDLDDILPPHFPAGDIPDQRHTAIQCVKAQHPVDLHAASRMNMINHKAVADRIHIHLLTPNSFIISAIRMNFPSLACSK